jgi:hypothetical protein
VGAFNGRVRDEYGDLAISMFYSERQQERKIDKLDFSMPDGLGYAAYPGKAVTFGDIYAYMKLSGRNPSWLRGAMERRGITFSWRERDVLALLELVHVLKDGDEEFSDWWISAVERRKLKCDAATFGTLHAEMPVLELCEAYEDDKVPFIHIMPDGRLRGVTRVTWNDANLGIFEDPKLHWRHPCFQLEKAPMSDVIISMTERTRDTYAVTGEELAAMQLGRITIRNHAPLNLMETETNDMLRRALYYGEEAQLCALASRASDVINAPDGEVQLTTITTAYADWNGYASGTKSVHGITIRPFRHYTGLAQSNIAQRGGSVYFHTAYEKQLAGTRDKRQISGSTVPLLLGWLSEKRFVLERGVYIKINFLDQDEYSDAIGSALKFGDLASCVGALMKISYSWAYVNSYVLYLRYDRNTKEPLHTRFQYFRCMLIAEVNAAYRRLLMFYNRGEGLDNHDVKSLLTHFYHADFDERIFSEFGAVAVSGKNLHSGMAIILANFRKAFCFWRTTVGKEYYFTLVFREPRFSRLLDATVDIAPNEMDVPSDGRLSKTLLDHCETGGTVSPLLWSGTQALRLPSIGRCGDICLHVLSWEALLDEWRYPKTRPLTLDETVCVVEIGGRFGRNLTFYRGATHTIAFDKRPYESNANSLGPQGLCITGSFPEDWSLVLSDPRWKTATQRVVVLTRCTEFTNHVTGRSLWRFFTEQTSWVSIPNESIPTPELQPTAIIFDDPDYDYIVDKRRWGSMGGPQSYGVATLARGVKDGQYQICPPPFQGEDSWEPCLVKEMNDDNLARCGDNSSEWSVRSPAVQIDDTFRSRCINIVAKETGIAVSDVTLGRIHDWIKGWPFKVLVKHTVTKKKSAGS